MASQHSDGGTNSGSCRTADFGARIPSLIAAALLAGIATAWLPAGAAYAAAGEPDDPPDESWVFPFEPPADPEDDGNQALAVNTTDGSVDYSVEFSLVWAEDGDPVETKNEAYAFANCTGCTAVAVGFQVVLLEEETDVIAPQNLSAAVNHDCLDCNTFAVANQLVLSLGDQFTDESMEQLYALWCEIGEFGSDLAAVPLSEIESRLEAYKAQITTIVQAAPSTTEDGTATSSEPVAEPAAGA